MKDIIIVHKRKKVYSPLRRIYAWVGFAFLVALFVVLIWKASDFMAYTLPDIIVEKICGM